MKPLRLEFQAFGSYPGKETVDFVALGKRGLFVVTGPTGSGKTTIFDAMVFALYGKLPGSRDTQEILPRSHHAEVNVPTYVQFDFEVDGVHYRVHRSPTQERPKAKGKGTTRENTRATLVRLEATVSVPIESQASRVSERCAGFVGLDASQFQRVVLLPQGQFTAFLLANESERESLLRPLFGGEVFRRALEWLKDEHDRSRDEVEDIDTQINHFRVNTVEALRKVRAAWMEADCIDDTDSLDEAGLQSAIAVLVPVRDEQSRTVHAARQVSDNCRAEAARAMTLAAVYDQARTLAQGVLDLETQQAAMETGRARLEASRGARPVVTAATAITGARTALQQAKASLDAVLDGVREGFTALDRMVPATDAAVIGAAVQAAGEALQKDGQLIAAADKAAARVVELTAAHKLETTEFQGLTKQGDALREELAGRSLRINELAPVASLVSLRRQESSQATQRLAESRALQRARVAQADAQGVMDMARVQYEQVMARFVATQAPRLATTLKDGEPCPVCGSVEHPAKAALGDGENIDHAAVDAARAAWSAGRDEVKKLEERIENHILGLGDAANRPIEHFEQALAEAERVLGTAVASEQQLQAESEALAEAKEALAKTATSLAAGVERINGLLRQLADAQTQAEQLRGDSAHLDAAALVRKQTVCEALVQQTTGIADLFQAVASARGTLQTRQEALVAELETSGYSSVEEAAAALLDAAQEVSLETAIKQWNRELATTRDKLDVLREQGVPDTRPQVELLEAAAVDAAALAGELAATFTTASVALTAATEALDNVFRIRAESASTRQKFDTVKRVYLTCHGKGAGRVTLERWVLARELENVTHAANVHLVRMSNHRFRLLRDETQGGLRLQVFDAHTGRPRATHTLSGGEQFQASLSLALGLADVVSRGGSASGRQFDALFVDEGFGSLDQKSLGDAINALEMIQAMGRMVGAITHVEEMKERLHVGIEVQRLPNESGSTLKVNP